MGSGTDLGRVRGLGSAKEGAHHWWLQRVTAIANIVLVLWFVFSLVRLPALDYSSVLMWLRQPVAAVPMLLLIGAVFWHLRLGMQVLIEDYVHGQARVVSMLALNFYVVGGAAAAVFAVLKIALGAA